MKRQLWLIILVFCAIHASAQTYEAKYKMIYKGRVGIPIHSFDIASIVDLTVKSNNEFIDVTGKVVKTIYASEQFSDKLNTSNLKEDVDMNHVIIDIKNKLAWYPEEKKMYRIKGNQLLPAKALYHGSCEEYSVSGAKTIKVIACKNLPKFLSPAIIFDNQEYGIKKIVAHNLEIELISKPKIISEKLEFKNMFENNSSKIEGSYNFFENVK